MNSKLFPEYNNGQSNNYTGRGEERRGEEETTQITHHIYAVTISIPLQLLIRTHRRLDIADLLIIPVTAARKASVGLVHRKRGEHKEQHTRQRNLRVHRARHRRLCADSAKQHRFLLML